MQPWTLMQPLPNVVINLNFIDAVYCLSVSAGSGQKGTSLFSLGRRGRGFGLHQDINVGVFYVSYRMEVSSVE